MKSRSYRTSGIVLRQYPLGEADRIVSILTPDMGKVRAVAKSVRRPKSKLRGHLDLTNLVDFAGSFGRNLDIVTEAQVRDYHPRIRSSLSRVSLAMYSCEVADSLAEDGAPNLRLYDLLAALLDALGDAPDTWMLVRWFEFHALEVSGFAPQIDDCVECGHSLNPGAHALDIAAGGMLCPECVSFGIGQKLRVSESAMRVLKYLARTDLLSAENVPTLSQSLRDDTERVLIRYLHFVVERDFKSAGFARRAAQMESDLL